MTALSQRVLGGLHRALAASTSDTQRLALALGPIKSAIRVVDSHTPPMSVNWAAVGKDDKGRPLSMSYTDFGASRIAINPLPILNGGDPATAIDIVTGFALHEASHGEHSRDRYGDLLDRDHNNREVPVFRPMRVAAYLWNLVEDPRIEQATSVRLPGFEGYFDAVLDWVWGDIRQRGNLPTEYGTSVADKLKVVFLACRFPEKAIFKNPTLVAEATWWQAWQADYHADRTDVRETIRRGLDHLGEDPETKQEMDDQGEAEIREEKAGERARAQLDRLIREGIKGTYGYCITREGDVRPLDEAEAAAVDKLVREGLTTVTSLIKTGTGAHVPLIRVSRPEEDAQSKRAYVGRPDGSVEALRAALVFRAARPRYDIKLQKSGELDDEELYRWAGGDYRLFTERVIEGVPDTRMGLLVDMSGSMEWGGYEYNKLAMAQRLAQLFVWALHDAEGVTTEVWGHTGDVDADGSDVYRLWNQGDPLSRLGLISSTSHGNNYDHAAIEVVLRSMRDAPEPQKVLVILSDGLPSGRHYGYEPAQKAVRMTADWGRSQGIEVIQIAIDPGDLRPDQQSDMFGEGNWIGFTSEADLPKQLTKIMARFS